MTRLALAAVLLLPAAAAAAPVSREHGDLALAARRVLVKYCADCHTGDGPAAKTFPALDHRWYVENHGPVEVVNRKKAADSLILHLLDDGSMPPAGKPRPTDEEIAAVRNWVTAKAPAYPPAFDDATAFAEILAHEKTLAPDAKAAGFRYVSFRHLFRDDEPTPDLKVLEYSLGKAIAAAGGELAQRDPIDDAGTIFRLDAARLGWSAPDLFDRVVDGKSEGAAEFTPFDLILLEYPFATPPPAAAKAFLAARRQVRPVPFLRGDWLTAALLVDNTPTPLAADLKAMKALADAKGEPPPGPKPRPFAGAKPSRPATADINKSQIVPLLGGVSVTDVVPNAEPFDLKLGLLVNGDPKDRHEITTKDGFRFQMTTTVETHVLALWVQADGDIAGQPLENTRAEAGKRVFLKPPGAPGFSIASVLTGEKEATEYLVLFVSEKPLPVPEVVRSRHHEDITNGAARIGRFYFPYPLTAPNRDPIDAAKIIRKVLPIRVSKAPG